MSQAHFRKTIIKSGQSVEHPQVGDSSDCVVAVALFETALSFLLYQNRSSVHTPLTMTVPVSQSDGGIAVHANDPAAIPKILEKFQELKRTQSVYNSYTRLDMLALARSLVAALETPRETTIKHNWVQVCIRILEIEYF
jgi:hypothetical protein